MDANDNRPEFAQPSQTVNLSEATPVGRLIARLRAADRDSGGNAIVRYRLLDSHGLFNLSEVTGDLVLAAPLDYETQTRHHATIRAVDQGEPSLSSTAVVTVQVLDENDNPPRFLSSSYNVTLSENLEPGHRLSVNLTAADADSGENGRLTYSIESGNEEELFSLDMATGRLYARKSADREAGENYSLTVLATDFGDPPLTGRAEVRVQVLDVNDCKPKFEQEEYRFVLQIDDKGNVSQQPYLETADSAGAQAADVSSGLRVTDCDAPPNGAPFSWSLMGGSGGRKFLVDRRGRFRVKNFRSRQPVGTEERLIVQACDSGQRTLCGQAKLLVRTVRADQIVPSLLPSNLTALLAYPAAGGEKLGRLRLRHSGPKDVQLRLLSHSDLFSLAPDGELSVAMATTPPDGLHRVRVSAAHQGQAASEQEVRVRVTLVTEAMAESAVPLLLGNESAHGFFLARRDAQLAVQLADWLRLGPDARVLLLAVQQHEGAGGDGQRQLMALVAVYEESRRAFVAPAEIRRRLNLSEGVRRRAVRLLDEDGGGCGLVAEALSGGQQRQRLRIETALVTFTAPEFQLATRCSADFKGAQPTGAVYGFFPTSPRDEVAWAVAGRQRALGLDLRLRTRQSRPGRLLRLSDCGGWRLALRLHADGGGRLEATAAVAGGEGSADRDAPELLRLASPRPVNDGAWHRVRLRLRAGSPNWTLELLTDSIQPQLGQLPQLPFSASASSLTMRVELDRFVGCLADLRAWPAADQLTPSTSSAEAAARRGCPEAELAAPCASTPCRHEGFCEEGGGGGGGGFQCRCVSPFAGLRCELNLQPCDQRPCLNGGSCRDLGDGRGGFACDCPAGLTGRRCELAEAAAASCGGRRVCQHGGWCEAGRCRCDGTGYAGRLCEVDVDECRQAVGLCGGGRGVCVNLPGGFRCDCPAGFSGPACERLPRQPGAAIGGGTASPSGQPLLLGLSFHELAAVLGCISGLLLLALTVFCAVSCYGQRRRGQRRDRRRNHGNGHIAKHSPSSMSPGHAADENGGHVGEEAMALMPMTLQQTAGCGSNGSCGGTAASLTYAGFETPLPPPLTLLSTPTGSCTGCGPCRSCSMCSDWGGPLSPQKPPPLLSFPRRFGSEFVDDQDGTTCINRGSVYNNFPTVRSGYHWDTSDWRGAATLAPPGPASSVRGSGNPPDLILDGGPFSVNYYGFGCRQSSAAPAASSPSNASTSTSSAASAAGSTTIAPPPLIVVGCGGGFGGFGGFGGLAEEVEEQRVNETAA